jgi:hypothetical protein
VADRLVDQRQPEPFAAVVEIHPQLVHPQDRGRRVNGRDEQGGRQVLVLGHERQALLRAACHLAGDEPAVVVERVGADESLAHRPLVKLPAQARKALAGALDVQVLRRLDGAVDLAEQVDVGRFDGADLHRGSIILAHNVVQQLLRFPGPLHRREPSRGRERHAWGGARGRTPGCGRAPACDAPGAAYGQRVHPPG